MVGADQRLAQAIRILVGEALAVEAGIGRVNDAVVVRADHHDVSADIRATLRQVLDVVGLRKGDAVVGVEVLAADLAAVLVVRLEAICEVLVAHELLDVDRSPGYCMQDGDAVVVVDRGECALRPKLLSDSRSGDELKRRLRHFGEGPLNVGPDEPLVTRLDVARVGLPVVVHREIEVLQAERDGRDRRRAVHNPGPGAVFLRPVQAADRPIVDQARGGRRRARSRSDCAAFPVRAASVLTELEQEGFARLQFRVLWFDAESEHGLLDALINLCWSHV